MSREQQEGRSSPQVSLRVADVNDSDFLLQVYESTRQEEMSAWGWNSTQQAQFVRMQFEVRSRGYRAAYPSAIESLIFIDNVPAGSMIVFRSSVEIRIVDIALLPQFRGQGIGSQLIGDLVSESIHSNIPLRLSVHRGNSAARLYERHGFVAKSGDAMYCEMERAPVLNDESR